MSQVDTTGFRAFAETQLGSKNVGDPNRDWQRSLESEGWRNILDTMHNFPGAAGQDAPDMAIAKPQDGFERHVNQANNESPLSIETGAEPIRVGDKSNAATIYIANTAIAPGRSAYALPFAGLKADGNPEEQDGPKVMRAARGMVEETPVALRKVLVLPSSERGVEVWVRDARITGAQMQMLLADIRRNVQGQGGEVSKVSVNGRRIDLERTERIESGQAKK